MTEPHIMAAERILFESPHHGVSDAQRRAILRALTRMPGATYARGGTHTPEWFRALSDPGDAQVSFEDQSFATFAACRERHLTRPDEDWWSADEMAHAFGWGDWERDTPSGVYHAFFCDPDVPALAIRDFVLAAFPGRRTHVVAPEKHARFYQVLPPRSVFEGLTPLQKLQKLRDVARAQPFKIHEYDPNKEVAALMVMRRDWPSVVVMDGVLDGEPQIGSEYVGTGRAVCQHMETLLRQPLTFVLVFRGPGLVRSVIEAERGRAPEHVPSRPTEADLQEMRDRERRASGAKASTSYGLLYEEWLC